jgi:recombination protein RecR
MMLHNLPTLDHFMRFLQQVPYLASKNIYRVATHFLQMDDQKSELFCAALLQLKQKVSYCTTCFFWQEKEYGCVLCTSTKRDQGLICVVESWQVVVAIERAGGDEGTYHVLTGLICPLEGVGPEHLTLAPLIERARRGARELIIALNQTPEGEATAGYIALQLKDVDVKISCLARGIPVGSSIEAMDRLTVYKALSERRLL